MTSLRRVCFTVALIVVLAGCGPKTVPTNGYNQAAVPGLSRERIEQILGKPQDAGPFNLPGVHADVLTYPFGQVLVQNGVVVAVSVNNDPAFHGPFNVTLGMSEDQVRSTVAPAVRHKPGYRDSYDAIEGQTDTRTRDIYLPSHNVMIELAAANANDPMAPFNVSQVTLANAAGLKLLEAFTKARVAGLYPDVHVDNFISEPWPSPH